MANILVGVMAAFLGAASGLLLLGTLVAPGFEGSRWELSPLLFTTFSLCIATIKLKSSRLQIFFGLIGLAIGYNFSELLFDVPAGKAVAVYESSIQTR